MADHFTQSTSSEPSDIRLQEILQLLSRQGSLIVGFALFGLGMAILYVLFCPKLYEATVGLKVPDEVPFYGVVLSSNQIAQNAATSLGLAKRPGFQGLSDQAIVNRVMGQCVVKGDHENRNIVISVRDRDPQLAAELANALAQGLVSINSKLYQERVKSEYEEIQRELACWKTGHSKKYKDFIEETDINQLRHELLVKDEEGARIAMGSAEANLQIVDIAVAPEKPVIPQRSKVIALGVFGGLFLGLLGGFFLEKVQDRILSENDVFLVSGQPPLAQLVAPNAPSLIGNPRFDDASFTESINLFKEITILSAAHQGLKTLCVLSATSKEDALLINSNFALALAQSGKKVLLVEGDLRRSSLASLFEVKVPSADGLSTVLAGKGSLEDSIVPSGRENLSLLPNTVPAQNVSALFSSEKMRQVLQKLKTQYELVVFDGAPLLPCADSVTLSTILDGVILTATYRKTSKTDLDQALRILRTVKAPLLGVLFSGLKPSRKFL